MKKIKNRGAEQSSTEVEQREMLVIALHNHQLSRDV